MIRKMLRSMYFGVNSWTPVDTIEYSGVTMYLDYETSNPMDMRPVLRAYKKYNLKYHVRKNCLGFYEVYCEKIVWGAG